METVTIYGFRGSPFVEKVVSALNLKGIPWQVEMLKTPAAVKRTSSITKKVPVVLINGDFFYDSSLILRKIDTLNSEPALWSIDPVQAARQRQLEDWCDESLYWYVMAIRWKGGNADKAIAQITSAMPKLLGKILGFVLKRKLSKSTMEQGLGRLPIDVLEGEVAIIIKDLSLMLGNADFFFGEMSAADISVYTQLQFSLSGTSPAFESTIANYDNLGAFLARMKSCLAA